MHGLLCELCRHVRMLDNTVPWVVLLYRASCTKELRTGVFAIADHISFSSFPLPTSPPSFCPNSVTNSLPCPLPSSLPHLPTSLRYLPTSLPHLPTLPPHLTTSPPHSHLPTSPIPFSLLSSTHLPSLHLPSPCRD